MNGQRMLQTEKDNDWKIQGISKAGALAPGIYNLYMAEPADKAATYSGQIVHADDKQVFQAVGKAGGVRNSFIVHDRKAFDIVPAIGAEKSIRYDQDGRAAVANLTQTQSRSRGL